MGQFIRAMALSGNDRQRFTGFVEGQPELKGNARELIEAAHVLPRYESLKVDAYKGAVSGMSSVGSPLRQSNVVTSWFDALRPVSALSRMTSARTAPALSQLRLFGTPAVAFSNLGEQQPIPVTRSSFGQTDVLAPTKTAALTIVSRDLLRFATDGTEAQLSADLAAAMATAEDGAFLNPTAPKSILHGVAGVPSTGTTVAAIDADVKAAIGVLIAAGSSLTSAAWILSPATATSLSMVRGSGGELAYPDVSVLGGSLAGLPVIVAAGAVGFIALVDQAGLLLDQAPIVSLDSSEAAAIEMSDAPVNNAATPTPGTLVSMFQTDSVALRACQFRAWALVRPGFATFIAGVTY